MKHLKSYSEFLYEAEVLKQKAVVPLSAVDKEVAKTAVKHGTKDLNKTDDMVDSKPVNVSVNKLSAAQTEIIPEKAIQMALGLMLNTEKTSIGGDLGSIISNDYYIMDGHHRWAATYLCDPRGKVQATMINLPGQELVSVLNVITVGDFDRSGNHGNGNINDFNAQAIGAILDNYINDGIPGKYPISAEEVKIRLGRVPGAKGNYERGKQLMCKNADALPKEIMPGAPPRVEMPVIGPDEVKLVQKKLKKGEVDFKEPHSNDVKRKLIDKGYVNSEEEFEF